MVSRLSVQKTLKQKYFHLRQLQNTVREEYSAKEAQAHQVHAIEWASWATNHSGDSEGKPNGEAWGLYRELDVIRKRLKTITIQVDDAYRDLLVAGK